MNKNRFTFFSLLLLLLSIPFAGSAQILTPRGEKDFNIRAEKYKAVSSVRLDTLDKVSADAMKWLYAYMPSPDFAGYSSDYFLSNVRSSLKARQEMPWGKIVPDREFRHFVLPVRVNNENLDGSRALFYDELKDRVKGLSMKDAILEVNHWCHEKATYQPSDGRTSSPLSTVSQAIGRCGEESTFTVAALRAVGIPARQIYTPRWAHTDDNHAWVEAWADGQWYFLGACEPAPILDMAWFNAPATRGLLMNTDVFGIYDGPEEVLKQNSISTTINVTSNYAPTGVVTATVVDSDGNPVKNAEVAFCIYNYAEFFPAVVKRSDALGQASLRTGNGDIVVRASDGSNFGFVKANAANNANVRVVLDKNADYRGDFTIDINSPRRSGALPAPSAELVAANNIRFAKEDSIRRAYCSGQFLNGTESTAIFPDDAKMAERFAKVLKESRGNGRNILEYISGYDTQNRLLLVDMLEAMSEKDNRDVPMEILSDALKFRAAQSKDIPDSLYKEYVLNPRVENEWIVPHRRFFHDTFGKKQTARWKKNPSQFVKWVAENISTDVTDNPALLRMDPVAVYNERKSDPRSRNIFCVSALRTFGVPARLDPLTFKPQYSDSGKWVDIDFEKGEAVLAPTGRLLLKYPEDSRVQNPKYYSNFTLSRIENGTPILLEYEYGTDYRQFAPGLELEAGQYLLLAGTRLAEGDVWADGSFFEVKEGETVEVPLSLRQEEGQLSVIGSLDAENKYYDLARKEDRQLIATTGRGYYVLAFIKPGNEPSAHILNDFAEAKEELEATGRKLMFLFADADEASRFDSSAFTNLPSNIVFGIDTDNRSLLETVESLELENDDRPLLIVTDTFNRIVFTTQGYTIGLGHRLADILTRLRD